MRPAPAAAVAAFAFLFLAQGQRALVHVLLEIVGPGAEAEPASLALAALPLLALLAPFLPVARLVDRRGAVLLSAAGLVLFRVPLGMEGLLPRVIGAPLVVGCAGLFLANAVGFMGRRAMALGAILGLLTDQLLRLGGGGADPTLSPRWLPAQVVVSLCVLGLLAWWARGPAAGEATTGPAVAGPRGSAASPRGTGVAGSAGGTTGSAGARLERRSGALRLRAALALGALLFLELHLLSAPALAARWSGVGHGATALALAIAGSLALGVALAAPGVVRGRGPAVLLALVAVGAAPAAWLAAGPMAVLLVAAGHGAALLLVARTLDPATGRRGPVTATLCLAALVLPALFFAAATLGSAGVATAAAAEGAAGGLPAGGAPGGGAAWAVVVAGILVLGYALLAPRPVGLASVTGLVPAGLAAVAFLALSALVIAAAPAPAEPEPEPAAEHIGARRGVAGGGAAEGRAVRWLRRGTRAPMPSSRGSRVGRRARPSRGLRAGAGLPERTDR